MALAGDEQCLVFNKGLKVFLKDFTFSFVRSENIFRHMVFEFLHLANSTRAAKKRQIDAETAI